MLCCIKNYFIFIPSTGNTDTYKTVMKKTSAQIRQTAQEQGLTTATVIPSQYMEIEYLAVKLEKFKTALFIMDNQSFEFSYSHTYNAKTDKTTYNKPKGF
jgi:hypothetical protein